MENRQLPVLCRGITTFLVDSFSTFYLKSSKAYRNPSNQISPDPQQGRKVCLYFIVSLKTCFVCLQSRNCFEMPSSSKSSFTGHLANKAVASSMTSEPIHLQIPLFVFNYLWIINYILCFLYPLLARLSLGSLL